mmetsp:Transcript_3509/g.7166  ORF Transcript_3509/g.7166 Transcript_3509/m.7166 type:complete len:277 (-) Transcript_3509:1692-2522(-)
MERRQFNNRRLAHSIFHRIQGLPTRQMRAAGWSSLHAVRSHGRRFATSDDHFVHDRGHHRWAHGLCELLGDSMSTASARAHHAHHRTHVVPQDSLVNRGRHVAHRRIRCIGDATCAGHLGRLRVQDLDEVERLAKGVELGLQGQFCTCIARRYGILHQDPRATSAACCGAPILRRRRITWQERLARGHAGWHCRRGSWHLRSSSRRLCTTAKLRRRAGDDRQWCGASAIAAGTPTGHRSGTCCAVGAGPGRISVGFPDGIRGSPTWQRRAQPSPPP